MLKTNIHTLSIGQCKNSTEPKTLYENDTLEMAILIMFLVVPKGRWSFPLASLFIPKNIYFLERGNCSFWWNGRRLDLRVHCILCGCSPHTFWGCPRVFWPECPALNELYFVVLFRLLILTYCSLEFLINATHNPCACMVFICRNSLTAGFFGFLVVYLRLL